MALFPEDVTSEHGSSLTAPVPDFATTGLPEKPAVTEAELRESADALADIGFDGYAIGCLAVG